MGEQYCVIGGAGFIGSHLLGALLSVKTTKKVTVYDNFSVGRRAHLLPYFQDPRLRVIEGEVKDRESLNKAVAGHDTLIHLASNADISRAIEWPEVDFTEGVYLTFCALEAARLAGIKRIIYPSGSGVYGDCGERYCEENQGQLMPISLYGASKLSGEAYISGYCAMFAMSACIFRFANVVGPNQTHGVAWDFIQRLKADPSQLKILGDGKQSKSYIYVDDVVDAMFYINQCLEDGCEVMNVATEDGMTVNEIAEIVIEEMGLKGKTHVSYSGGDRGWKGDVPIVRLSTKKINAWGWRPRWNSTQAVRKAVLAMLCEHDAILI